MTDAKPEPERMAHTPSSDRDLRARVLAAAAATPSTTRAKAGRIAAAAIAASVTIAVTVFQLIGGVGHGASRPWSITLAIAAGWIAVSAFLTWLVIGRGASTMARRPALLVGAALATPVLVYFWMHLFHGTYPDPPFKIGYRCLSYTLVMSALPLGAFLALRRAVEPRYPAALGAAAGAACASWGGALIDLWCPITDARHILVGHVAPLVGAIAIGALVGRLTLGVRGLGKEKSKSE